uniref:Uncharacterized protein n=1 Tax=Macrostomum lignano TaxID=282301 RepID=A0A1I8FAC4_9PLAT
MATRNSARLPPRSPRWSLPPTDNRESQRQQQQQACCDICADASAFRCRFRMLIGSRGPSLCRRLPPPLCQLLSNTRSNTRQQSTSSLIAPVYVPQPASAPTGRDLRRPLAEQAARRRRRRPRWTEQTTGTVQSLAA